MPSEHELKICPEYYRRVVNGFKTVELREDDRGYQVGDTLILNEWIHSIRMYTDKSIRVKVTDIVAGGPWLADGYVAMSIRVEVAE